MTRNNRTQLYGAYLSAQNYSAALRQYERRRARGALGRNISALSIRNALVRLDGLVLDADTADLLERFLRLSASGGRLSAIRMGRLRASLSTRRYRRNGRPYPTRHTPLTDLNIVLRARQRAVNLTNAG